MLAPDSGFTNTTSAPSSRAVESRRTGSPRASRRCSRPGCHRAPGPAGHAFGPLDGDFLKELGATPDTSATTEP